MSKKELTEEDYDLAFSITASECEKLGIPQWQEILDETGQSVEVHTEEAEKIFKREVDRIRFAKFGYEDGPIENVGSIPANVGISSQTFVENERAEEED